MTKRPYPEKKRRKLTDQEKRQIRTLIKRRKGDIYEIADEISCSSSQVAGIKGSMNRK